MERARIGGAIAAGTVLLAVISVVVVVGGSRWASAHGDYDVSSVEGRWGFFEEFRTAERYGTSIGVAEFDGRGGCTIEGVKNGGDTVQATQFHGECEYSLRRDGRGAIVGPAVPDLSFVIAEHGRAIAFIRTERGDLGRGEMRPMGAGRANAATIAGRWSWIHPGEVAGLYGLTLGTVAFDGEGKCVMKYTENGGDRPMGASTSRRCEYEVGPSGWGRIGTTDQIVVTGGGSGIYFMHGTAQSYFGPHPGTLNVGWGELTPL